MNISIPDSLEDISPELTRFVHGMVYKLEKNKHKGKWEGLNLNDILSKLKEEVTELEEAIKSGNTVAITLESCDVANFAMIAAAIAIDGVTNDESRT